MKPRIQKQRRTHRLKRVVISGLLESSNMKQASADYSVRFHAANRFPLQLQGLASPRTVQIQVDAECRCHKRPKNNRNFAKSGVRSARKQPRMLVAVERFTDRWISNYTKTGVAEKTNKQTNKPHSQGGEASDEEVWRNGQEVLCRDLTPRRALSRVSGAAGRGIGMGPLWVADTRPRVSTLVLGPRPRTNPSASWIYLMFHLWLIRRYIQW